MLLKFISVFEREKEQNERIAFFIRCEMRRFSKKLPCQSQLHIIESFMYEASGKCDIAVGEPFRSLKTKCRTLFMKTKLLNSLI